MNLISTYKSKYTDLYSSSCYE